MDLYTITLQQLARNVARIAAKDRMTAIGLLSDLANMNIADARTLVDAAMAAHPVPYELQTLTGELEGDLAERVRIALEVAAARTAFIVERLATTSPACEPVPVEL